VTVPGPRTLTVFHFTDLHARLGAEPTPGPGTFPGGAAPGGGILAGLAGLDALLAHELDRAPPGPKLLVCCGDVFGAEIAHDRLHRGGRTVQALARVAARDGLDAAVWLAGNHDVDHGLDRMIELAPGSGMLLLGGNIRVDGAPLSDGVVRIDVGGVRVGIVGVTTVQVAADAQKPDRPRIGALPPVRAGERALTEAVRLREGGALDVVLALAHCFDGEDERLARMGPDLLLGGHTHVFLSSRIPQGARREKAGCHGQALGRAVLRWSPFRWRVDEQLTGLLLPDVPPSPQSPLLRLVADTEAEAAARRHGPPIARHAGPIRGIATVRTPHPSPVGSAVAAGLLAGARFATAPVHCAFVNAGNVRAEMVPRDGALTEADLCDALPYGNGLVLVEGPPDLLREALCVAVASLKVKRAGWLRTAGLAAHVTASGEVRDIRVESGGALVPLDSLPTVRIATLDWLGVDGGDNYGCLPARGAARRLGLATGLWAASLATDPDRALPVPPDGLTVDEGFRQTDTRAVLDTLDELMPGSVTWARALDAERRPAGTAG
jgi:2',3'-cyclic-nucleotide 2'-phosphodiesterase (5'-nucleotidase family)